MHKVTIKTGLLFAVLLASGIANAGGRVTPMQQSPTIIKTAIDAQGSTLIISGRHFGTTLPTVMLSDQALAVQRFSEREVVASLPRGLEAATYGVTVNTGGPRRASSNIFSATLPDID